MIPVFETISVALKSNNLTSNDIDENLVNKINSKYYTFDDFINIKSAKKTFNIFHTNVDGYECHADGLREILSKSSINFDVVCLSETSQQSDHVFPKNVTFENYHYPFSTTTKSRKGGVAIFVKDSYNVKERHDLNINNKEFEANWIEINLKKCKNIIIACIYRHPHITNLDEFIYYFNKCLSTLNKENKEIYITGDFNIDLLKYDSNPKYQEFYNLTTANGFLPQIFQPTRLTDSSMTLIDNIYTNNFSDETFGGNLLIEIADHLAQFLSVEKDIGNKTQPNYYKRDYKQWQDGAFMDDLSIQNWQNDLQDMNEIYDDFIWRFKACVNRHAPQKKVKKREQK